MIEKDKLLKEIIEKSGKTEEEINNLVYDKINELSGLVSEEGALYIIANELGIQLDTFEKKPKVSDLKKIKDLKPDEPVSLLGKVLKKYDKINFNTSNGNVGSVQSLLIGDETGITRLTFWNDQTEILDNIKEGDILKVLNAYSRTNTQFQDRIDVHYGKYSDIEINPEGVTIDVKDLNNFSQFVEKKIDELNEDDKNVKIKGVIIDMDIPRFYMGCPQCFKKVIRNEEGKFICEVHNEVEPIRIPIVNLIVDDGTGKIAVIGFRDRAEELLKETKENIIKLTEDLDRYREFLKSIVETQLEIAGNIVVSNLTGEKQLVVNSVNKNDFEGFDNEKYEKNKKTSDEEDDELLNEKEEESKDEDVNDFDIEEIDIDDEI